MSWSTLFQPALAGFTVALLLLSSGCTEERQVLGQAYVAPQTLAVRSQVSQKSGTVVTLKHGEKVNVIDVQRRMVKVATASGFEGWADSFDLLSPEQMKGIMEERQAHNALPSEGPATAFETLNLHIEPSRRSPAFAQIAEGGAVTILGRTLAPKNAPATKTSSLVVGRPQPLRRPKKEAQAKSSFHLPPRPAPPKPPANWQELSAERIDGVESEQEIQAAKKKKEIAAKAAKKAPEVKKPVVMEDWTLVRTKAGDTGWVLTRNLSIAIPDEVAQYAEGKRITSFFDLGTVTDEEKGLKHNWLWTTLSSSEALDFDSWRVFLWNTRHHRYETSFRQRDIDGYFPVHVDPADPKTHERTFQIVTRDEDGKFRRRTYLFDSVRVHLQGSEDYQPQVAGAEAKVGLDTNKLGTKIHPGWFRRQWNAITQRFANGR